MNTSSILLPIDFSSADKLNLLEKDKYVLIDEKIENISKLLDFYTKLWDLFYTKHYGGLTSAHPTFTDKYLKTPVDFKSKIFKFKKQMNFIWYYDVILQNIPISNITSLLNPKEIQDIPLNIFDSIVVLLIIHTKIIKVITHNYKLTKNDMIFINRKYKRHLNNNKI